MTCYLRVAANKSGINFIALLRRNFITKVIPFTGEVAVVGVAAARGHGNEERYHIAGGGTIS